MRSIHCLGEKMSDFGKKILNRLLDKYENSVISKKGSNRNLKIALTLKDKELNTYICNDSYNYRDENDAILAFYEEKGFITLNKDKYGYFESLLLNFNNVDLIYNFLGRDNPIDEITRAKKILGEQKKDGIVGDFCDYCCKYIDEKSRIPRMYFDSSEQLEDILMGIKEIENLTKETRFREFSMNVWGYSKKFEQLKPRIAKVICKFDNTYVSDDYLQEDVDEILAHKNLVKNSTYALIKGRLEINLKDVVIDIGALGYEFCLSDEMIKDLKVNHIEADKVVTVENLTSFYDFNLQNSIVIYLGGFHNHTKRMLIKKLYNSCPTLQFYHFGDIDAGGILILKHLREKTDIEFKPYKMDIMTLLENKQKWQSLTDNDVNRLNKINDTEFKGLIRFMIDNNCKLEQEGVQM